MVKPGERLGNYEVATAADGTALVLGSGAGGITYRGKHIHLGTEVAIKVLVRRKNLLQKDRDAFLAEARAAASLAHPQIARILDFGESSQQHPYYVMELCEGGSLEDFGRKAGPPDDYALIQWMFESAAALAYAHQKGILHRDIKPSNLLVARQDDSALVKLIDFGLADLAGQEESADQVIGTPHFAAPEQLHGRAQAASDVFSLGATFLWLITGKHLSQGDVKSVISERLESTGYSALLTALPPSWQSLLGRMLEIDPSRRPHDGADLFGAVQMTFPHHPGHPIGWDASAEFPGGVSNVDVPTRWQDFPELAWSQKWTEAGATYTIENGVSVKAHRPGETALYDVSRFSNLDPETADLLHKQGDLVARSAAELGLNEVILERGAGWWSVAWPVLGTTDALSWVRQGHSATTAEILAALDPVAAALDTMKSGGFEGLDIHPSMLAVRPEPPLAFSLALPLPVHAESDHPGESSGTMRGTTGAGLSSHFGSCVYQLLSGRTPPPAAFVNARAYQAIPKLTEQSNRFLSSAIAGTLAGGSCRDVIRGLAHEERIPGASYSGALASGGGASRTAASWRTNPSISMPRSGASLSQSIPLPASPASPPPPIPPAVAPAPASAPAPPPVPVSSPALESSPSISSTPVAAPAPPPVPATQNPAASSPPPIPAQAAAPAKVVTTPPKAAKKSSEGTPLGPKLVLMGIPVVVLILMIGGGWFAYQKYVAPAGKKSGDQVVQEKQPEEPVIQPDAKTPETTEVSGEPARQPSGGMLSLVKVPGDATTLAEAVGRCEENGTIEISGGTYSEALVLTKSVSLVSKSAAVLEEGEIGSSLLTAKGPVTVTLRNIQIKNSQREAAKDVDSSPSLILVADGATMKFEGCVIEGSTGNGVSLADKASASFSNCRIRKNRGYGISASSGSNVTISLCEIRGNGLSGVVASNVGTTVSMGSGTTITENSRNGVEVANGAELSGAGAEILANQKVGLMVEGAGSLAKLESSSVVSGNRKFGVGVTDGGRLVVSGSTMEDNSENGIFLESGGKAEVIESQFKSNGTIGIYLVGGAESEITVSKSVFQSHSDAGVAVVEGIGKISDSRFMENPMAVFFGKGSSGSATGNAVRPGPVENAVVIEDAGQVSLQNNTLEQGQ